MQTVRAEEDPFAGIPSAAQGLKAGLLPPAGAQQSKEVTMETETIRRFAGGRCSTMSDVSRVMNDLAEKYRTVELLQLIALPGDAPIGYLLAVEKTNG